MNYRITQPFLFMTSSSLVTVTGRRAADLKELLDGIKEVPGSSIYHHSHQAYREWQTFDRPPVHDFGYWAGEVLRERSLGEKLSTIDPTQHDDVRGFRDEMIRVIEKHLEGKPLLNRCPPGSEFSFCQSVSVISSTGIKAGDLGEFMAALGLVTNRSLYYHLFEARLRLHRADNDFSIWMREQLKKQELAEQISRLDIAVHSLDQIRARLFAILGQHQGISALELVRRVAQLPVDMVESLLTEILTLPVRTATRFWGKSPRTLAHALTKSIKHNRKGRRSNGSGPA
ncbi:hypothetical protein HY768_07905 [candidate division TA06 bacterium]|uniref:Uncharacterized protein n=1 Tax=candidate division TA06 bacterium TaxID=2250710 RepID=A0A933MJY7_UNCT6|nr:hypothetical protein [candidate division TA06 bacterium]